MDSPTMPSDIDLVSDITFDLESDSGFSDEPIPSAKQTQNLEKHNEYYLPDGDLFIQVESTLFRIHSYFFYDYSPYLRNLIEAAPREGYTEDSPVCLDKDITVSVSDFGHLLWVFYDKSLERNTSGARWINILLTAEKLDMEVIIRFAIDHLKTVSFDYDPVVKISIQQRYSLPVNWARAAYLHICQRTSPLTSEEGALVGIQAAMIISRAQVVAEMNHARCVQAIDRVLARFASKLKGIAPPRKLAPPSTLDQSQPHPFDVRGSNLSIKVGDTIFRVHSHFMKLYSSSSDTPSVFSEEDNVRSITLSDVDPLHFSWFLWVFYDRGLISNACPAQWNAIRIVANRLKMADISAFAVKQIRNTMDLIDQIVIIEKDGIRSKWADEAWQNFRSRSGPLTADEWRRLGSSDLPTLTKVAVDRDESTCKQIESLRTKVQSLEKELKDLPKRLYELWRDRYREHDYSYEQIMEYESYIHSYYDDE